MAKEYTLQPVVKVGILNAPTIHFILHGNYTRGNGYVTGEQTVRLTDDGKIEWNGQVLDELDFKSNSPLSTFELIDVVIGVNFHWERKENQSFKGDLLFLIENGLEAVNIVPVEDYLTSVISSEMSATASLELLKAHAVISRSWLLAQIEKHNRISDTGQHYSACTETDGELIKWYDREDHVKFHVCADDHCQRYQGVTRQSTPTVAQAVAFTRGQVLTDGDSLCDARFSKCCGGVFEQFEYCWEPVHFNYLVARRDNVDPMDFPDLRVEAEAIKWIESRPDAFCNTSDAGILSQVLNNYDQETTDFYRWTTEYTREELSALVRERSGIDFGEIIDLQPVERGTSGRLSKLRIVGTARTMVIGKELEIRRTLSTSHLYSSAFIVERHDVDPATNLPGRFILRGAGWGHGVGLCQIGAAVMGAKGYDYTQILNHYYPGADITKVY